MYLLWNFINFISRITWGKYMRIENIFGIYLELSSLNIISEIKDFGLNSPNLFSNLLSYGISGDCTKTV